MWYTSFMPSLLAWGDILVVGCNGYIFGLDMKTGNKLWRYTLVYTGYNVVTLTLNKKKNILYCGTNGRVEALYLTSSSEPKMLWKSSLEGHGFNAITLAFNETYDGKERLFVGIAGYIVCIDAVSGTTLKEVNLKLTGYRGVSLLIHQRYLIAATNGSVYCYDNENLDLIWFNNLEGFGYGAVSLMMATAKPIRNVLLVGLNSQVIALDPNNGGYIWEKKVKIHSVLAGFVTLTVHNEKLLACADGKLKGLSIEDGSLLFEDNLNYLGYWGGVICSTEYPQIDFNSQPIMQDQETKQKRHHNKSLWK